MLWAVGGTQRVVSGQSLRLALADLHLITADQFGMSKNSRFLSFSIDCVILRELIPGKRIRPHGVRVSMHATPTPGFV